MGAPLVLVLCLSWTSAFVEGNLIGRHERDDRMQPLGPSGGWQYVSSGEAGDARLLQQKQEETRVLLELYYLAKVLQAYRLPGRRGTALLEGAIARLTEQEFVAALERLLRKQRVAQEISLIGAEGTVPDRLQVQLANDGRLLYPLLIRTLRRVLGLKKAAGVLPLDDKDDLLGALLLDMRHEWLGLREALHDLEEPAKVQQAAGELHTIQWADVLEPDSSREDSGRMEYFTPTVRHEDEADSTLLHRPIGDREDGEYPETDLSNVTNVIHRELAHFLLLVEELAQVDGLAAQFNRHERAEMAQAVGQRFQAAGALDQRYFVEALRTNLNSKEGVRGRQEALRVLAELEAWLDAMQRHGREAKRQE